jgi:hypothetical protein
LANFHKQLGLLSSAVWLTFFSSVASFLKQCGLLSSAKRPEVLKIGTGTVRQRYSLSKRGEMHLNLQDFLDPAFKNFNIKTGSTMTQKLREHSKKLSRSNAEGGYKALKGLDPNIKKSGSVALVNTMRHK